MSVEIVGQCPTAGVDFRPVSKLHDRARDSKIAHQIKLGPRNVSMAVPPPSIVVDPRLHFVTFVFQYRSPDALHAVGIVPRMPMTEFEDSEEGTSNARIPNAGGVDSTYQNLPIGVRRELINEADITEWHTTSKTYQAAGEAQDLDNKIEELGRLIGPSRSSWRDNEIYDERRQNIFAWEVTHKVRIWSQDRGCPGHIGIPLEKKSNANGQALNRRLWEQTYIELDIALLEFGQEIFPFGFERES
ncbi:hypothetical protein HHX47_DHR7000635 [Lentinula edodes]|nr:hypothetical protein HHX47_DHR7000635 [Lentinula edodes]